MREKAFITALLCLFIFAPPRAWSQEEPWRDGFCYRPEPIILVHGIDSTHEAWNDVVPQLRRYFSQYWRGLNGTGTYIETVNYGGKKGEESFQPVEMSAYLLWLKVVEIRMNYERNVNLVCHSLGGLVAKQYLSSYGGRPVGMPSDGYWYPLPPPPPLRRLVTLGTPHKQSLLALATVSLVEARKIPPWNHGYLYAVYTVSALRSKFAKGSGILAHFIEHGMKYGSRGSMYTMAKVHQAWDKIVLRVPEAVLVYFPDDGVVSESSQRADGLESITPVVRLKGPNGVKHTEETKQLAIIVRALDGIETFSPGGKDAEYFSDRPRLHGTLTHTIKVKRRRLSSDDPQNKEPMIEEKQYTTLLDLEENIAKADFEKEIPRIFLSKGGMMTLRYEGQLAVRHKMGGEYLPASTDGGDPGTKVHIAVKRYSNPAQIPFEFPADAMVEAFSAVKRPSPWWQGNYGIYAGEIAIGDDGSKPYVAVFTQAVNPAGLKSQVRVGVFRTIPSIVPLVRALNERQELFEDHGAGPYRPGINQAEYITLASAAGKPDGGRYYPAQDALDGVRADGYIIDMLRYDTLSLSHLFYTPARLVDRMHGYLTPYYQQELFQQFQIGDGKDRWTTIPKGAPGGPTYGWLLDGAVFPIHLEEIRRILNVFNWISLVEGDRRCEYAELTKRADAGLAGYPAFRQTVFSEWQAMVPVRNRRGLRSGEPDGIEAGIRFYMGGKYGGPYGASLRRARVSFMFKVPLIQREAQNAILFVGSIPRARGLNGMRVSSLSSWPGSYWDEGTPLLTLPSKPKLDPLAWSAYLPVVQLKDYYLKFAIPNALEQSNLLPLVPPGYPNNAQEHQIILKDVMWGDRGANVLLKVKFTYPGSEPFVTGSKGLP